MSVVTEIITTDQIHDLWGSGFTIVERIRHSDPFHVDPAIVPSTRSYQWMHLQQDKIWFTGTGWAPVPHSRHEGLFAPFGTPGDIEIGGLGLFEKPKFEVDRDRAEGIAAAHKQVSDWIEKTGALDISGEVKFGDVSADVGAGADRDVYAVSKTKSLETTVKIPKDMVPHMAAIFEERDRLKYEVAGDDDVLKPGEIADRYQAAVNAGKPHSWPTLNAILLPIAIENVRKALKEKLTQESAS